MTLFERCYSVIRKLEGGVSNHKNDKGGTTKWGITQATYSGYLIGLLKKPIQRSVVNMTEEECKQIYLKYWLNAKCDELVDLPMTALVHYDLAINSGSFKALSKLQELKLIENFTTLSDVETSAKYLKLRQLYYDRIILKNPSQAVFKNGWSNRLKRIESYFEFITTES